MPSLTLAETITALEEARDLTEQASVNGEMTSLERATAITVLAKFDNLLAIMRSDLRPGVRS